MNDRQRMFVAEYVRSLNATQAATAAGYSAKTAYSQGERLLKNVEIRTAIDSEMAAWQERIAVDKERVLRELARIAFAKVPDVVEWDETGTRLLSSRSLRADVAAAVKSVKVKRRREVVGGGRDAELWEVEETEVTLHDKVGALNSLAKHLNLFPKETPDLNVNIDLAALVQLARADEEDEAE